MTPVRTSLATARALAATGRAVVEGDECDCHIEGNCLDCHGSGFVAPAVWVAAAGECPTCGGDGEWSENWPRPSSLGRIRKPCPDCRGGLHCQIEVPCTYEGGTAPPEGHTCDGWAVFGWATIEVLPVVGSWSLDGSTDVVWTTPNVGSFVHTSVGWGQCKALASDLRPGMDWVLHATRIVNATACWSEAKR